ncbi:MAG: bifunctional UDP-N-acetylmuramoyl-tripeptide:D-alanyl-D-alanine ligase/alanine racemase, partial [Bacteroidetes bacterium]
LPYTFWKHASNTGGIERGFFGTDTMVRLGIGLYGVSKYLSLHPVLSLTTTIAQIREVAAGESVGYSRAQIVTKPSKIATIRIGYADGFMRSLSNGEGFVYVEGVLAPVVGRVCMDMTMIDVTHVPNITLQSKVEIFGTHLPVTQVAEWANTIAYDVLTHIHHRVPRVYIHD